MPTNDQAKRIEDEIKARYRARTQGSKECHDDAQRYLPAGDTRIATYFAPYPTYMITGDGAWLTDYDGNRYLDLLNNYTSLIHGHAQPEIVEQAADQLTRGTVFGSVAQPQVELAKLLTERVPSLELLRFTNSGTEATMLMMRAARAFKNRDIIVKIEGGFHGGHDFVEVSVSPDLASDGQPEARLEGRGIPADVLNAVMVAPFNDLPAMAALLQQHHERIAGIIIEPMPNAGGLVPPAPGYLRALRALADEFGVLLLFDEIVTLRLSPGGFQEIANVKPDLTALGKIIGGGFPVGAFGGRSDIMELFNPVRQEDFLFHSGTFNGNNMTMTAGLTAMQRLDQAAIERVNGMGEQLQAGLRRIFAALGIRAQCLGHGSLQQIHWTDEEIITLKDASRACQDIGKLRELLHLELLNRDIYTVNRGLFSIATPMQEADIARTLAAVEAALKVLLPYMRAVAPRLLTD